MKAAEDINMYKGLANYFLPEGVLSYFDVVGFSETSATEKDVLYKNVLHIYLDEHDNRTPDMMSSIGNGYTEEKEILDFPIRGRKAIIHVRRHRWLMPDGTSRTVDLAKRIQLEFPGTRYSKDFALFLKRADGQ